MLFILLASAGIFLSRAAGNFIFVHKIKNFEIGHHHCLAGDIFTPISSFVEKNLMAKGGCVIEEVKYFQCPKREINNLYLTHSIQIRQ